MSSIAPVVNQSNIHTQFAALQADRDRLRNEVNDLERSRRKEEQALRQLRSTHATMTKRIRAVNDTLGKATHQLSSMESDQRRLLVIQKDEERQLKSLSEDIGQINEQHRSDTKAYVAELDRVNSNAQQNLNLTEERKLVISDVAFQLINNNSKGAVAQLLAEDKLKDLEQKSDDWVQCHEEQVAVQQQVSMLRMEAKKVLGVKHDEVTILLFLLPSRFFHGICM
jgi:chromosome segregation ATPase